ncbi:MAG: methyl-accepting chemotaxis protein [Pseudomonadota bacterium]
MKLRNQIIAIVIIPIASIAAFSLVGVSKSAEALRHAKKVEHSVELTNPLSSLVHELQVERGMSAGHIASEGVNFAAELPKQRQVVDRMISQYNAIHGELITLYPRYVQVIDTQLEGLAEMREHVSQLAVTVPQMAGFYTATVRSSIELSTYMYAHFEELELSRAGAGLANLTEAKEAAGLERAMGATGFGRGAFPSLVLRRFGEFGRLQRSELAQAALFTGLLGDVQFQSGPEFEEVSRLREIVFSSDGQELKGISATEWFTASTAWIEHLRDYESQFKDVILAHAAKLTRESQAASFTYIAASAASFGASIFGIFILIRSFGRKVGQLTGSMAAITEKSFEIEIDNLEDTSEIGDLSRSLNTMRIRLKNAEDARMDMVFKGAAFNTSGAPMILANLDFEITDFNEAFRKMVRAREGDFKEANPSFDASNLVGHSLSEFQVDTVSNDLSNPANLPFRCKLAIGEAYLGLLVEAITDTDGELVGYVLDWKDQTYQMENQVIMDAIDGGQGRLQIDLQGTVVSANETFATWMGKTPDGVAGMTIKDQLASVGNESTDLWEKASTGKGVFDKFRLNTGDATIIIDACLAPIPNHQKETKGYLLLGTNITRSYEDAIHAESIQNDMMTAQTQVVQALQASLSELSQGDLSAAIHTEFTGEYEDLRTNYNAALASLSEAMSAVLEATSAIRADADEVKSATNDLSKRTESQAATLEETSAALTQLTVSVQSASEGAENASEVVQSAQRNAESSGEIVKQAISAMNEIETSSAAISNIIGVIDDIAFQTNLLALNAGVEAARAGEAGRGFAVVASEVRGLAQRASEAAREITQLITSSGEQVQKGAALVNRTGEALTEIMTSIHNISDHVGTIAVSAKEQSSGITEINEAVADLDRATQHNTAMVEETTATAVSLNQQTETLWQTSSRFKTQSKRSYEHGEAMIKTN